MIEFRKAPASVMLDNGRYLFGAIARADRRLIFISPYYFDSPIDLAAIDLRIAGRPVRLAELQQHVRIDYEPCLIHIADVDAGPVTVDVSYGDFRWSGCIDAQEPPSSELSLMTICKDDHRLIPQYVRHYAKLGVTHFFFYYNGLLDSVDWSFLSRSDKIGDATIIIYEWPIPHRWPLTAPTGQSIYDRFKYQHHGQPIAINHHLHTTKHRSRHCFFIDLDEYVFTPKPIIDRYRADGVSGLSFQCWWAAPQEPASFADFVLPAEDRPMLIARNGLGGPRRKWLVKLADVDLMGIHGPRQPGDKAAVELDGFFHICRFAERDRSARFLQDAATRSQDEFIAERFPATA